MTGDVKLFTEAWDAFTAVGAYVFMGLVAILGWVGRRHINKMDKVADNYISEAEHVEAIEAVQEKILHCQQSVRVEQQMTNERLLHMANRIDALHEMMLKHYRS